MNGSNWRRVAAFTCGVALVYGASALESPFLVGVVTGVIDGDTIKVQLSTGPVTVRLGHIDAPEVNQSGGGAAVRALDSKILGEEVSMDVVTRDGNERLVAVVFLADENVNAWMVKQGHAWAYRGHTKEADYCVWENAARSLQRGLWRGKKIDWVAPWDWRETKRDPLFFVTDYSSVSTASCMREISQTVSFDE